MGKFQKNAIILMGDIIGSRSRDQAETMRAFQQIIEKANSSYPERFLSPLTITLGDEFQGVARDVASGIQTLIAIEESLIRHGQSFKLNYIMLEGRIETPINPVVAHGMMGQGLTEAREELAAQKKAGKGRFQIRLRDEGLSKKLSLAFTLFQSIVDDWHSVRDFPVVSAFLDSEDYKEVAIVTGKTRSQIWKREHSLKVTPYKSARSLLLILSNPAL